MFGLMTVKRHKQLLSRMVASSIDQQSQIMMLADELANWRANGQLRDPKTGRLIPRAK